MYDSWFDNYISDGQLLVRGIIGPHEFLSGTMVVFSAHIAEPEVAVRYSFRWAGVRPHEFKFKEFPLPEDGVSRRAFWEEQVNNWWARNDDWAMHEQVVVLTRYAGQATEVPSAHPALMAYYYAIRSVIADRLVEKGDDLLDQVRAPTIYRLTGLIRDQFKPWRSTSPLPLI